MRRSGLAGKNGKVTRADDGILDYAGMSLPRPGDTVEKVVERALDYPGSTMLELPELAMFIGKFIRDWQAKGGTFDKELSLPEVEAVMRRRTPLKALHEATLRELALDDRAAAAQEESPQNYYESPEE